MRRSFGVLLKGYDGINGNTSMATKKMTCGLAFRMIPSQFSFHFVILSPARTSPVIPPTRFTGIKKI